MTTATEMRATNIAIVNRAKRDMDRFTRGLDLTDPEAVRDALLRFMPTLTTRYGEIAASLAADWYDELRAEQAVAGRFSARMADPVPTAAIEEQVRFGAQHLWSATPEATFTFLAGNLQKYVLQPARDTIQQNAMRDPQAAGWHRETRAGSCKFCRMLAGRGEVYKKESADFSAHTDCNCVAVPSWDADAEEVGVKQYVASERTSAMSEKERADHTARVRAYLADVPD